MSSSLFARANHRLAVLLIASSLSLSVLDGCSAVHVRANQASVADDIQHKTVVALWWGVDDPLESVECGGQGLHLVSVKTSWIYSLCTVVTLGAVVPMDIEYRCTSKSLEGGDDIGLVRPSPLPERTHSPAGEE